MNTMTSLVNENMEYAQILAKRQKRKTPQHVCYDDLESAAYFGLVHAADRFKGGSFKDFAYPRIQGAMKDWLRDFYWGDHRNHLTFESLGDKDDFACQEDGRIQEILDDLPKDMKEIFQLYYIENYSLRQVGEKVGLSESAISRKIKKFKKGIEQNV